MRIEFKYAIYFNHNYDLNFENVNCWPLHIQLKSQQNEFSMAN